MDVELSEALSESELRCIRCIPGVFETGMFDRDLFPCGVLVTIYTGMPDGTVLVEDRQNSDDDDDNDEEEEEGKNGKIQKKRVLHSVETSPAKRVKTEEPAATAATATMPDGALKAPAAVAAAAAASTGQRSQSPINGNSG